jgi:hypothetical protein
MPDYGLFIGWHLPVRGRERASVQVFTEAMEYYSRLQQQGEIESVEPVFLEAHGGDLGGFILLRGEREALTRLRTSEEFVRMVLRANLVVESLGVVGAYVGDSFQAQMERYQQQLDELAP